MNRAISVPARRPILVGRLRRPRLAVVAGVILGLLVLVAIFAPLAIGRYRKG